MVPDGVGRTPYPPGASQRNSTCPWQIRPSRPPLVCGAAGDRRGRGSGPSRSAGPSASPRSRRRNVRRCGPRGAQRAVGRGRGGAGGDDPARASRATGAAWHCAARARIVRAEANHVAGEPVSEEARAALLAVVVEAIGNKYFKLGQRILSGQFVHQRLPQRRVADEISAVVLAAFLEPIGAGRHRNQPLRFAGAVDPAVNADLVAPHRLAAQAPGRFRLVAARTGYVRWEICTAAQFTRHHTRVFRTFCAHTRVRC